MKTASDLTWKAKIISCTSPLHDSWYKNKIGYIIKTKNTNNVGMVLSESSPGIFSNVRVRDLSFDDADTDFDKSYIFLKHVDTNINILPRLEASRRGIVYCLVNIDHIKFRFKSVFEKYGDEMAWSRIFGNSIKYARLIEIWKHYPRFRDKNIEYIYNEIISKYRHKNDI